MSDISLFKHALDIQAMNIYEDLNHLKTGIAFFDHNFKLIFANKTIRAYFPTLYASLDSHMTLRDSIIEQSKLLRPDIDTQARAKRADLILDKIKNSATWEVGTPCGRVLQSCYSKTARGTYMVNTLDISHHAILRNELTASRRQANSANRAKSEFLANMTHEIRTPLSGVFLAAQLLQKELRAFNQSNLSELADILVGSTTHLSAIINDVLDMSKIESGQVDIVIEKDSLSDMLHGLKLSQGHVAKAKGIILNLTIDPSLPNNLIFDLGHVRQCITNLINNALKFTANGSVTVIALYEPQTHIVTIHVADTGIGIVPEELSKVFNAFEQVKADTAKSRMGTGLGLSISQKLARLMGGDITVESKLGSGSIFTLTFETKPIGPALELLHSAA